MCFCFNVGTCTINLRGFDLCDVPDKQQLTEVCLWQQRCYSHNGVLPLLFVLGRTQPLFPYRCSKAAALKIQPLQTNDASQSYLHIWTKWHYSPMGWGVGAATGQKNIENVVVFHTRRQRRFQIVVRRLQGARPQASLKRCPHRRRFVFCFVSVCGTDRVLLCLPIPNILLMLVVDGSGTDFHYSFFCHGSTFLIHYQYIYNKN